MAEGLNIEEFKQKVKGFLVNLPTEVSLVHNKITLSLIPAITNRLIKTGIDGKGKSLGKYSTNPLPTFFFTHKGLGSGADKKVEALIKKKIKTQGKEFKGISYTEFRELNNRPTDHVTLSFTGETLADIKVLNTTFSEGRVTTDIGALGSKTKAKYNAKGDKVGQNTTTEVLDFLGDRYGVDLLQPNQEEEDRIETALEIEMQTIFDKYFGS